MKINDIDIESLIIANLLFNDEYARRVSPFLKNDYFENKIYRKIFEEYAEYVDKYGKIPTIDALIIEIDKRKDINQNEYSEIVSFFEKISSYKEAKKPDINWLVSTTENYCRNRAIYNAIFKSIDILENKNKKLSPDAIPDLLRDALSVSFDLSVGHDFLEDAESRWDFYHNKETHIPFDIDWLNKITNGGVIRKTLNVFLAPTNTGKTLIKCHLAASFLTQGYNVLYITLEMAEEKIAERIDANLLDVDIHDLQALPKDLYMKKIKDLRKKTPGKLIIKEYPAASAHVGHFRALLNELEIKKDFRPDILIIDYLNICASSRMRRGENMYSYVKSIAEELRGLATEKNVAVITSTQTNRDGWNSSDLELKHTSESAGLPATADLMIGVIVTEQHEQLGQMMFKQLKNRYTDKSKNMIGLVGVDKPKMRLYNLDGVGLNDEEKPKSKKKAKNYKKHNDKGISQSIEMTKFSIEDDDENPFAGFEI